MRLLLLLALVAACASGPDVRSNYDGSYSFAGKTTFGWAPYKGSGDPRIDDAALTKNVRDAVARELTAKGYTLATDGKADFVVAHHAVTQAESSDARDEPGLEYGRGNGDPAAGGDEYVYLSATLILEMRDGGGGPVVWSARARDALFVNARESRKRRKTGEAVRAMLADFPAR